MVSVTAVDITFLVRELKELEGSIVEKVFHPEKRILVAQLHKSGTGKILLRIVTGSGIYITKEKPVSEASEKPSSFSMLLRKKLKQARVTDVVQPELERVIEIQFSNGLKLIIETFSKGNVVLCEKDGTIIAALEKQEWKHRSIKKGVKYILPPGGKNPFHMTEKEFSSAFKKSDKESAVKVLAMDFSLGGKYAEEVCLAAKIEKNRKRVDVSKIFKEILRLKNRPLKPFLILDSNRIVEFSPIELKSYKETPKKSVTSVSAALEELFNTVSQDTVLAAKGKDRLVSLAKKQELQIEKLKKKGEEYKKIGDLIYEKYNEIEKIIKEIKDNNWKVKNPLVKELNKKERKVILEL